MAIRRAAVLGAGVMGSGIAAHIANAGVPVDLLDIVPEGAANRNALAEGALDRMAKARDPKPFMHRRAVKLVRPGNLEDHLDRLAEADWIVEAVIEDAEVKRDLYRRVDAVRRPGSVVSSNTSTIPLAKLTDGLPGSFARDFIITHFFNPPRYMRLLEIVAGPATREEAVALIREFADRSLGKGVVMCKDTPGFIANRIGGLWMECAITSAIEMGLTVEEADAVMSRPVGIPRTGIFGLLDLVGIDLAARVGQTMRRALPPDDRFLHWVRERPVMERLIAEGYTGRKGKGGFYRLTRTDGGRVKEALDLRTGEYRPAVSDLRLGCVEASRTGGLRALVEFPDRGGRYAWQVVSETLAYAAGLVPEITDTIVGVDEAMRLGYAWREGPFEMIDRLGPRWFADRLRDEGRPVPPLLEAVGEGTFYRVRDGRLQYFTTAGDYADVERPEGVLLLADVKRAGPPVAKNGSAALWDVGDGVLCLEFTSKMNAIDPDILEMIERALDIVPGDYRGLVIYNEADNFSVGANIGLALFAANVALWPMIEEMVARGQRVYRRLKYAPFPVVAAPSGMALGGGCEILLHSDAVQAHGETYAGLVEVGVGLVPAWGGCTELLTRWLAHEKRPKGPIPPIAKTFETIAKAEVARSAFEARDLLLLRPEDGITMNRDRLLADAKARVLALAADYAPPDPPTFNLAGPTAAAAMDMAVEVLRRQGRASEYDAVVARELARVLSGGDTDIVDTLEEDDLLRLERAAFMALVRRPKTLARMEHTLETGKPLRN